MLERAKWRSFQIDRLQEKSCHLEMEKIMPYFELLESSQI